MAGSECFVVMPYGRKPLPDSGGQLYDFDKVYRVMIQRAIREAGLLPRRSDESASAGIIHSDMFRDLRDRPVVLADLSLDNPNVFYELGMRHVMRASGTVLICRAGSVLPFDIKLSRVIFYEFDGRHLDWEEVERVVQVLRTALTEAQRGLPDSPVHALLDRVMPATATARAAGVVLGSPESAPDAEPAAAYQQLVAAAWQREGRTLVDLFDEHRRSVFGSRALACLSLGAPQDPAAMRRLANHLNDGQQYRLANRLYAQLHAAGQLSRGAHLAWASSHSEAHPDRAGADEGLRIATEVLEEVERQTAANPQDPQAVLAFAECHRRLAGLRQWRWELGQEPAELDAALAAFDAAVATNQRARELGLLKHPGFLAQARLKQVVLLRIRDGSVDRPDREQHREAILALAAMPGDDAKGLSYLGWFQAITLADLGQTEAAQHKALLTLNDDARLRVEAEHWEIGRRQYGLLRRFLGHYLPWLHEPSAQGQLAQMLQLGAADAQRLLPG